MTTETSPAERAPGLFALLAEDLRTHDGKLLELGFWALAVHRLSTWADGVEPPLLRRPLQAAAAALSTSSDWLIGIKLAPGLKLGRRVRVWHHGATRLFARSIGDDVHIRQNTTCGPAPGAPDDPEHWPVIGDRVELGSGVCVLGAITIGHDSFVAANSLVTQTVAPNATVVGVPARVLPRRK